ncbi:MAG: hypothetical protein HYR60_06770 [Acidobacteria bacterium]|nr:hypothetical protein [Acidobacteriota bacterium]
MKLVLRAALLLSGAGLLPAQKYNGPRPPKPDIPYLVHADNLVQTEVSEAREETRNKEDLAYVVQGASSPAKTPLAGPIFLLQSEKIQPDRLQLYRFEAKSGHREVFFSKRKGNKSARSLRLSFVRLAQDLYRIEVIDSLENGEYSLSPEGSNQVFCFQVY